MMKLILYKSIFKITEIKIKDFQLSMKTVFNFILRIQFIELNIVLLSIM